MNLPLHYLRTTKYYLQGKWRAGKLPADVIKNARGKIAVLYHGIDHRNDTSVNTKFIGVKNFEEQIRLLKKHTNVISLQDYTANILNPDKLNVAITFDDGFLNNYQLAKPILEKYDVPASFFITPIWHQQKNILWSDLVDHAFKYTPASFSVAGEVYRKDIPGRYFHSSGLPVRQHLIQQNRVFIDALYKVLQPYTKFMQNQTMDIYWKLMGDKEVKELAANPLFMIGSHAYTHTYLTWLTDEEALDELKTSKNILETLIQKPVDYFASPFGAHNERSIELTRKAGYKYQIFASLLGDRWESEKDLIPRFGVNPYLSPANQISFIANKKF